MVAPRISDLLFDADLDIRREASVRRARERFLWNPGGSDADDGCVRLPGPRGSPRMDLATAPIGIVVPSESICPDEILEQDPWYGKLLLPYKWHYGGGVMLQMTETESAGMSTGRHQGTRALATRGEGALAEPGTTPGPRGAD